MKDYAKNSIEAKKQKVMENIKIATAQFEHRSGDKDYNLRVIESLAADAASKGADVIAFHECSIT